MTCGTRWPRGNEGQHLSQALQRRESKAINGMFAILVQALEAGPLTDQITLPH